MGAPPDEHLPEVVHPQPQPTSYPEVVPNSAQEYYVGSDKHLYPVQYDDAPKLLHEGPPDPYGQQHYYQQPGDANAYSAYGVSPDGSVPWQSFPPGGGPDQTGHDGSAPEPEKRICGLGKRRFILIAVIIGIVVVAAAVGGGVGGSMASRKASSDAAASSTTSSSR
jgi:hypothetical protein